MATQPKSGSARPKAAPRSSSQRQNSSVKVAQERSTKGGKSTTPTSRGRPKNKIEAENRLVAADRQLAKELPRREVDLIVKDSEHTVALIQTKEPRTSPVTGEIFPSPHEVARVRKENLLRSFRERHLLLHDA